MMYRTILLMIAAAVASSCASQNCGLELPRCKHDEALIEHIGYTLSYNDELLSAKWVAWELTSEEAEGQYPRDKKFYADPDWQGLQADNSDYHRSGWSRGHLAPAGDMKWSEQAMRESCYLTNICPQDASLNDGSWRKLEELCRRLTDKYGTIWICCGPVFYTNIYRTIGANRVAVPDAFFKVLLVKTADGAYQSIGFVFKNNSDKQPLADCSMSVDDVERITGLDFYPSLPNRIERKVESTFNLKCWNL